MKFPTRIQHFIDKVMPILESLDRKNHTMLAAGIAYFATLSFFPLMVTVVAFASLVSTPEGIARLAEQVGNYMPPELSNLLITQLSRQSAFVGGNIVAAIIGITLAFVGASGAIENLIRGLNVAYEVKETRNIIKLKLTSFILTIMGILGGLVMLSLLVVNESVFGMFAIPLSGVEWILYLRWPLIVVMIYVALTVLYHFAPNRRPQYFHWRAVGTLFATVVWLIATLGFFVYVQVFAKFSQSYGVFASLIILMMWLNLSAIIVLIGAELNKRFSR